MRYLFPAMDASYTLASSFVVARGRWTHYDNDNNDNDNVIIALSSPPQDAAVAAVHGGAR